MWLPSTQMTQASCTDWPGCSHPSQFDFLKEQHYLFRGVRPTQTVMLHRYPAVIHSDLEWSNLTYCRPQSQFCLFTSLPIFHVIPLIMFSNMIHNLILDLNHWPIAPLRFSSLLLGLVFPPLIFKNTSLPFISAPRISFLGCCPFSTSPRLEHLVLIERSGKESVSDPPPAANIIMFSNWGAN